MRLHSIQLVNFVSHKNSLVHFHNALTIVLGPNGAGKTAILDGTKFAAGSTTKERVERLAGLIRRGEDRSRVILTLKDAKKNVYTVERVMKESYRTSRINKKQLGIKEVNHWFMRHNFNPDSPVCVLVQGEATWPFQAKPEKRFSFFEESLGIKQMRMELLNKIKTLEEHSKHLLMLEEEKDTVKATLNEWKEKEQQFHRRKAILKELDSLEIEKKWSTLHLLEKNLNEFKNKEKRICKEITTLEANPFLIEINNTKKSLEKNIQAISQLKTEIKFEERAIESINQNLRFQREDKKKIDENVTKRQEQLKKVENRVKKKQKRIEKLEKKSNEQKEKVEANLGKNKAAGDIVKEIKHWEGQKDFILDRIQNLEKEQARLNGQKQILENDITMLQHKVNQHSEEIYEFLQKGDYEIDDPERLEKEVWERKKELETQISLVESDKRKIRSLIQELEQKKNADLMYTQEELEFLGRIRAGKYFTTEGPLCEAIQVAKNDHTIASALLGDKMFGFVIKSKTELVEILKIASTMSVELTIWYEPWLNIKDFFRQNTVLKDKLKKVPDSFQQILALTTPKEVLVKPLAKIIESPPPKGVVAIDPQKGIRYQDGVFSTLSTSRFFYDPEELKEKILEKQAELEIIKQNQQILLKELNEVNDELTLILKCKSQLLERKSFRNQIDEKEKQKKEINHNFQSINLRTEQEKEEKKQVEQNLNSWKELRKTLEQLGEKEETIKKLVTELENEGRGTAIVREELNKNLEDQQKAEDRVKETEKRLTDAKTKITRLEQEIKDNDSKNEKLNQQINELHNKELEIQKQLSKARNALKIVREDINYYKEQSQEIKLKLKDIEQPKIQQSPKEIEKRIRRLTLEISTLEEADLFSFHKLIEIEEEFTEISEQIDKKKREVQIFKKELNHASDEWKNKIQDILQAINRRFGKYVKIMGAKNGEITIEDLEEEDPRLKILGQFDTDDLTSAESASGGEKTLLTLGFMFAIQDHLKVPYCLLDEFQLSLDGIRLENAIKLIKEASKKRQFILFVPGEERLDSLGRYFDYGVILTKQDGYTVVTEVGRDQFSKETQTSLT